MRVVFMGTPDFAIPILEALIHSGHDIVGVVTQPDRPLGRKQVLTPPPIKVLAEQHQIPVFQPESIRKDYQPIIDWRPDLIITCAYGQIIPKILLDLPPLGAINVHASLLPKYRGGAPIQWAIINGEKETGITLMYMSEKMDAGDIIAQSKIPIEPTDNYGTLHDKLSRLGAELLMEILPQIEAGTNDRIPQDESLATYAWNIKKEDERIVWDKDAQAVVNQIRGLSPVPGAYTCLEEERFKIYEARVMDSTKTAVPGTIVDMVPQGLVVACGKGQILIIEGQLAGRKRQPMENVLRGNHPFAIGKTFES